MQLSNDYNMQEIILHRASQLISLTGVNLLKHLPDDSNTTMVWNEQANLLHGRTFELGNKEYCLGIELFPFELKLLNSELETIQSIKLDEIDQNALYNSWENWLKNLGFKGKLVKEVHYDLPQTPVYQAMRFEGIESKFAKDWVTLRSLANNVMQNVNTYSNIESEINIWPHHFDTGVYYPITTSNGETIQSIGVGLAIADAMIGEPYFYIFGWTKEGTINYKNAPELEDGQWLTEGWQGAVMKASNISSEKQVSDFLKQAFDFLKNELSKNK